MTESSLAVSSGAIARGSRSGSFSRILRTKISGETTFSSARYRRKAAHANQPRPDRRDLDPTILFPLDERLHVSAADARQLVPARILEHAQKQHVGLPQAAERPGPAVPAGDMAKKRFELIGPGQSHPAEPVQNPLKRL
jgi:hypothetical protein